MPAPLSLHPRRAALSPIRIAHSHDDGCAHGAHPAHGTCAVGHDSMGSYGVMLLAVAIVLLGIVVLTVTWRRGRAGVRRVGTGEERGA